MQLKNYLTKNSPLFNGHTSQDESSKQYALNATNANMFPSDASFGSFVGINPASSHRFFPPEYDANGRAYCAQENNGQNVNANHMVDERMENQAEDDESTLTSGTLADDLSRSSSSLEEGGPRQCRDDDSTLSDANQAGGRLGLFQYGWNSPTPASPVQNEYDCLLADNEMATTQGEDADVDNDEASHTLREDPVESAQDERYPSDDHSDSSGLPEGYVYVGSGDVQSVSTASTHRSEEDNDEDQDEDTSIAGNESDAESIGNESVPAENEAEEDGELPKEVGFVQFSPETKRISVKEDEVTEDDFLCGRENTGTDHQGNVTLLQEVRERLDEYDGHGNAHGNKTDTTKSVLEGNPRRRFIYRSKGMLYLKTYNEARVIVSQKFRDMRRARLGQMRRMGLIP